MASARAATYRSSVNMRYYYHFLSPIYMPRAGAASLTTSGDDDMDMILYFAPSCRNFIESAFYDVG